jgi:hypothetical protein
MSLCGKKWRFEDATIGLVKMGVRGIDIHVLVQQRVGTWMCFSGLEQMVVSGLK